MPYSSNAELPKGVKNLPPDQQTKWRKVFNAAYEGTCKDRGDDRDSCAAKIAWSQIDEKYKHKSVVEFSMALRSVTHDKKAGTLRWKSVASDTDEDYYHDNMSLELFNDFTKRIEINEFAPESFRSSFWQGGMPYVSISHYPDLEGKAVPGSVERIFVDGNQLKADGQFYKTPLGFACYYAICKDLYEEPKAENPVRVSIAFLDYGHTHKSNGYKFVRDSIHDVCPECIRETIEGQTSGKIFEKGQLVHLALTRVPANDRTSMEVEKSMATRKEDAESIVGKEFAEELDDEAKLVGKSQVLVIKSDEEVETESEIDEIDSVPEIEAVEDAEVDKSIADEPVPVIVVNEQPAYKPYGGATSMSEAKDYLEAQREQWRVSDLWYVFQSVVENIIASDISDKPAAISNAATELKEMIGDESIKMFALLERFTQPSVPHVLDDTFSKFKSVYDEVKIQPISVEEKLMAIQESFNEIGEEIKADIYKTANSQDVANPASQTTGINANEIVKVLSTAISDALSPIASKLDLLLTQQSEMVKSPVATPVRRSIPPTLSMQKDIKNQNQVTKVKSSTPKLRELIERNLNNAMR